MEPTAPVIVHGKDGLRGTVARLEALREGPEVRVEVLFEGGRRAEVPVGALVLREDGSYEVPLGAGDFAADAVPGDVAIIPVVIERAEAQKRTVETGRVRVAKVVREREEVVDEPLFREEVAVERVPVGREVAGPVSVRLEGDTMVVPVVEEVLVVEKRLVLKEELRITRRRVEEHRPQRVTLRAEEVTVERIASPTPGNEAG
jgi:uncharacterized protein (TIGR02271 family)